MLAGALEGAAFEEKPRRQEKKSAAVSFPLPAVNPCHWSEPLLLLVWAIACWPFLLTRPPSSTVSEWANWYLLLKWASPLEVDSSPVPLLHSDRPRKLFFYFWDFLFYVQIRICSGNDRGTDMWPLPTLCIPCCHFCKLCSLVCFCVQSHVCKSSQIFCLKQSTSLILGCSLWPSEKDQEVWV